MLATTLKSNKYEMAPTGFEPATPGLRVQYSNRAELRGQDRIDTIWQFKKVWNFIKKQALRVSIFAFPQAEVYSYDT